MPDAVTHLTDRAWSGDASVRDELERLGENAERTGQACELMVISLAAAVLAYRAGETATCDQWLDRGLAVASPSLHLENWLRLMNFRAQRHLADGRLLEAIRHLLAIAQRADGIEGLGAQLAQAFANLAVALHLLGDTDAAASYLERAVAHGVAAGGGGPLGQVAAIGAASLLEAGRTDGVQAMIALARAQAEAATGRSRDRIEAVLLRAEAWWSLRHGAPVRALERSREATVRLARYDDAEELASCALVEVSALLELERLDEAAEVIERARALAGQVPGEVVIKRVLRVQAELASRRGDVDTLASLAQELTAPEWSRRRGHPSLAARDLVERFVRQGDRQTAELETTNEALRQSVEALAHARDDARADALARKRFLGQMSHELRTPLHGVLGTAELLRERVSGDEAELVDIIGRSASLTLAVVDDVLDLGKLEAGELSLESEPYEVAAVVGDVIRALRGRARHLDLTWQVDEACPEWVRGDGRRVQQVLMNLVGNGLKFASSQVSVHAGVPRPGWLRWEVEDDGPGIPEAAQQHLFDPYFQGHQVPGATGTGLGLAICKAIAETAGGRIGVDSVPGQGSRFWIEVPAAVSRPARTAPTPDGSLDGLRVMLAEDNPVNRMILERQLRSLGAEVRVLEDGPPALAAALDERPDLLLLDLHMPGMGGDEVSRRLREQGYDRHIVALTASVMNEDRQLCMDAGMDAVLTKPLARARLLQTVSVLGCRAA